MNLAGDAASTFHVTYDVTKVPGARGALIEISAPTKDFLKGLFFTGDFQVVNNFTNPSGDRLDRGNRFGQPGSVFSKKVRGMRGVAVLDGKTSNLSIPAGACDNSYQVRVFALDGDGKIVGVASNPSLLSYTDLSSASCAP